MKNLMKQPFFLGGVAAVALAVVLLIVGTVTHPAEKVAEKFCKGLQKMDQGLIVECMAPDVRENYSTLDFIIGTPFETYTNDKTTSIKYIIGDAYETEEEGVTVVPVTIEVTRGKTVVTVYRMDLTMIEIDGKEYIRSFY